MRNGDLLRAVSRFAVIGVIGSVTAACSSDRFAGNQPFSNPFSRASAEPVQTGSIARSPSGPGQYRGLETEPLPRMASSHVEAAPLAPPSPSHAYSPPPSSAGMPSRPRTASGTAGWSTAGGTTVIVGPGETLSTLTSRYGVPGEAILSANGLKPGEVTAGRRVVIPVYSATQDGGARRVEAAPPAVRYNTPPAHVAAAPASRVVGSQKLDVKRPAPRTVAEAAPPKAQLRPGRVAAAPAPARVAAKVEAPKAKPEPKLAHAAPKPVLAQPKVAAREVVLPAKKVARVEPAKAAPAPRAEAPQKVAASEPVRTPARDPDATASIAPAAPAAAAAPASSSGAGNFRWPARGRVISGYSGGNEGINIAVPEGTPVKAAGDGVVAYAGSEVKGYGNLVLIRHDNGYVSAYANNGEIDVKRGQRVTRGQSIAKSGQTGNVTSPQLHFELRKGSTPVDPTPYLNN